MNDLRKVAQEQSTDTKSAIGGTRMSEAATPAVAAGNRVSTTRIVGGAGVALAASVVVQNACSWAVERPPTATPLGEVLAYHAENRGAVAVAVGQEAVNLPLLLLFVTGLHGLVQRRGGAGRTGRGSRWQPERRSRRYSPSSLPRTSRSCSPRMAWPSRPPSSSWSGSSMPRPSRSRCPRSGRPSSARRWPPTPAV